jgi:hypothetical protein
VAAAVLKAIHAGPPEIIVNWPPMRPAIVLREIFPRIGEMLTTAVSKPFLRRAADMSTQEKNAAATGNSDQPTA